MKKIYILLLISSVLFSFYSCDKEDDLLDESVVLVDKVYENDLDKWIYENLTKPYNVEVIYKWTDGELANDFHVVPPKIEKAEEFLHAYLNLWVKTYQDEATENGNPDFLKQYMPKQLVLTGGPQYNSDGTITLGLAESGRKITIFNIDAFGEADTYSWDSDEAKLNKKRAAVIKSFHVMHHEFGHILHQTKFYPDEFKEISKGSYTANWVDISDDDANKAGFITSYSMLNENEDFVEIVAGFLDNSMNNSEPKRYYNYLKDEDGFLTWRRGEMFMTDWEYVLYYWGWELNEYWEYVTTPETVENWYKFQAKVDIVTTYYKEKWGIDLYEMQKRIEAEVSVLYPTL